MSLDTATASRIRQFQSETDAIREAPEPVGPRITTWVLAAFLAGMAAIMLVARIDRIVTSSRGRVVPSEGVSVFQALDPSIIKSIDVKEGQKVAGGQLLATLDQTFAAADVNQLRQQIASLDAQIARDEAELGKAVPVFPRMDDPDHARYAALQQALYLQRKAQFSAQMNSFNEKISQTKATVAKLSGDDARFRERERISRQIESMRQELHEKQVGSLLNLLNANDQRLELLRTIESTHNSLIESEHALAAALADRDAFGEQWSAALSQELVTARNQRDAAVNQFDKAMKHQDLVRLVAPEPAVVLTLAKLSVGSVLKEGDPLMTLMPLRTLLEVEAEIASRDIGFVRPGDRATIKVDAFNAAEHGTVEGRIVWLSEGAFTTDQDGKPVDPYYRARIGIDGYHFVNMPENFRLIPGMTLTADIHVGTRSVFGYVLGGLLHGAGEAMREP